MIAQRHPGADVHHKRERSKLKQGVHSQVTIDRESAPRRVQIDTRAELNGVRRHSQVSCTLQAQGVSFGQVQGQAFYFRKSRRGLEARVESPDSQEKA